MASASAGVAAHPGDLDRTFASDGIATQTVPTLSPFVAGLGQAIAVDHRSRIVTTYYSHTDGMVVVRDAFGNLDTSFGTGGSLAPGSLIIDAKLDSSDRILVLSNIEEKGVHGIGVARYSSDGFLDTTFGTSGKASLFSTSGDIEARSLEVDGDISVVAGNDLSSPGESKLLVGKIDAAGTPDLSFGLGGVASIATMPPGTETTVAQALVLDHSKNIYIVGGTQTDPPSQIISVAKFTSIGTPDITFAAGAAFEQIDADPKAGWHYSYATSLAVDAKDNLVVSGTTGDFFGDSKTLVTRLLPDGTADTAFNGGSYLTFDVEGSANSEASSTLIDAMDRIILTGIAANSSDPTQMAITRLLNDGSFDANFGHGGSEVLDSSTWSARSAFTHDQHLLLYGDSSDGVSLITTKVLAYDPLIVSPPSGF